MKKYRKKPVVVEAVQLQYDNGQEIVKWIQENSSRRAQRYPDGQVWIETLEGIMKAQTGDYIIKGVKGEFYPCKPDIFALTYEAVV